MEQHKAKGDKLIIFYCLHLKINIYCHSHAVRHSKTWSSTATGIFLTHTPPEKVGKVFSNHSAHKFPVKRLVLLCVASVWEGFGSMLYELSGRACSQAKIQESLRRRKQADRYKPWQFWFWTVASAQHSFNV